LNEGLKVAGYRNNMRIQISFIDSERLEKEGTESLKEFDGIVVPGGFGNRGIEGMILAAQYAREHHVPYL
jgi:CTP synthase